MSDVPEPMTPPDCDLRGFEFMPYFGDRLASSTFYELAFSNPRAFMAAHRLWWQAWKQCPAASLPNDDVALARLADFGENVRNFKKNREISLHGFVLCSDGRLYHPMLAILAIEAWERRKYERQKKQKYRQKQRDDQNPDQSVPVLSPHPSPSRPPGQGPGQHQGQDRDVPPSVPVPVLGERKGEDRKEEERVPTSSAQSATKQEQISPPEPQPENARDTLWRDGLATLRTLTGQDANRARSLLGRLLKPLGDDCAALLAILDQARDLRPIDPVPWLIAAADARKTTPEQKHQDSVRKMFELLEQEEPGQNKPKPQLRIAK
jgi:hypothetical protein